MKIPLGRYWDLLAVYIKDQRSLYILLCTLLISSIGLKLLVPQITRIFIDSAAAAAELNTLMVLGLAFVGAAILQQVLAVCASIQTKISFPKYDHRAVQGANPIAVPTTAFGVDTRESPSAQ